MGGKNQLHLKLLITQRVLQKQNLVFASTPREEKCVQIKIIARLKRRVIAFHLSKRQDRKKRHYHNMSFSVIARRVRHPVRRV